MKRMFSIIFMPFMGNSTAVTPAFIMDYVSLTVQIFHFVKLKKKFYLLFKTFHFYDHTFLSFVCLQIE